MAISLKHKDIGGRLTKALWLAVDTHEIDVPHDALSGVTSSQHHTRYADSEAVAAAKVDTDIADALSKKHANTLDHSNSLDHSHVNKTLLDTYTQTEANLADAVSKKHANTLDHSNSLDHSHGNKTLLDTYTQTEANLADAVARRHDAAHTHPESEIINLVTDLAGKEPANVNIQTHVTSAHAPSNAQKNSDILKSEIEAKLTGEITSHNHPAGGAELEQIVLKTGDTANSTTTLADAVGLAFAMLANKTYLIEGFIVWSSSAITVGIQLSATVPSSPSLVAGHFATDAANGTPDSSSFNANNVVVTTSASPFTAGNLAALHCVVKNGANPGNFQIRFAAETTGTITIKAGSVLRYRQLD